MEFLIDCITKMPCGDPHQGITHLGGPAGGGWRRSRAIIVHLIETKTDSFYTKIGGKEAAVVIVQGPNGKYVRTHADGSHTDDLLSLKACTRPIELSDV